METNYFRKQISDLLNKKGMSIARLSRLADLSPGTVYNFLAGKSEITTANFIKMTNVLNKQMTKMKGKKR